MTETAYLKLNSKTGKLGPRYHEVPIEALPDKAQKAWAARLAAIQTVVAATAEFEACVEPMTANSHIQWGNEKLPLIPTGHAPAFGYNFGKFAIAAVPAAEKRAKGGKATASVVLLGPDKKPKPDAMPDLPASLKRGKGK